MLRQEIERTKYSKDKESYTRFVSGLVHNKAAAKENEYRSANRTSEEHSSLKASEEKVMRRTPLEVERRS